MIDFISQHGDEYPFGWSYFREPWKKKKKEKKNSRETLLGMVVAVVSFVFANHRLFTQRLF